MEAVHGKVWIFSGIAHYIGRRNSLGYTPRFVRNHSRTGGEMLGKFEGKLCPKG